MAAELSYTFRTLDPETAMVVAYRLGEINAWIAGRGMVGEGKLIVDAMAEGGDIVEITNAAGEVVAMLDDDERTPMHEQDWMRS